ncbi:hypothetical protein [Actinokineospora diospyrosa]|uniref:Uncharacterized protein n=1 Tax=Actinokineospora diospyrosa TaxID=103728 RepID=A0ABT1I9G0_9PSEU|nr:hypothetical protein [Actinokineospora diospyrosa]MCP2269260.1 hypothetical protein [Actinokineospora diospyrosa]
MSTMRDIVATVVVVDCPLGQVARAVDDLSSHLPAEQEPGVCPFCVNAQWPCGRFLAAAQHIAGCGVDVSSLVPVALHPVLWPATKRSA